MTDSLNRNGTTTSADDDLARVKSILFGAEQRRTNDQIQELRQHFEEQLEAVRSNAERERQEMRRELVQQLELLRAGKLDREALAEMFGGMVSRLGSGTIGQTDE